MTAHMLPRRRRSPFARIGGRMVENDEFNENVALEENINLVEAAPVGAFEPVSAAPMAELPPITAVIPRAVTAIVEPIAQPVVDTCLFDERFCLAAGHRDSGIGG